MQEQPEIDVPHVKNPKHKLLADIYLRGGSKTAAAIEAGYSKKTAGTQAVQILSKSDVAEYVQYMREQGSRETQKQRHALLSELDKIAFSNVADFTRLNSDGDLEVDFSNATRDQLAAVSSVRVKKRRIYDNKGKLVGEEHNSEFRLWDKLRAAELLGKHEGLFAEPEQKIVVDVADRLLAARSRVRALTYMETETAEFTEVDVEAES